MDVVDTALNGEEAIEKLKCLLPDVVLMDIMLKPLSGLQTTRIIKQRFQDTRIIMITASETEDDLFESVKSRPSGYLLKSLDADVLYEMLVQYEHGEIPVFLGLCMSL